MLAEYYHNSQHNNVFTKEQQEQILKWFNHAQKKEKRAWDDYSRTEQQSKYNFYIMFNQQIKGAKSMLEALDCFVEYDWVGHRGEWFFVEEYDIEAYVDWLYQCAD